jgi:hypothetical protein
MKLKQKSPTAFSSTSEEGKYEAFDAILSDVINQTLIQILGKSGAKATFFKLEQKYDLKSEMLPNNLEKFHVAMLEIFGPGALLIEEYVVRKLHSRFHLRGESIPKGEGKGTLNLPDCVENLKIALNSVQDSG